MEKFVHFVKEYPVIAGIGFFAAVALFLGVLFSVLMHRAGLSLRPLAFIAVFGALIVIPQAAVHIADAVAYARQKGQSLALRTQWIASARPVDWTLVFGADADPDLITDAKVSLSQILAEAEEAKLAFKASGETALAARFPDEAAARRALDAYGAFFGFHQASGSDEIGWTARRYGESGDWCHVVTVGRELYAWTGPHQITVELRRAAALGSMMAIQADRSSVSNTLRRKTGPMIAFAALNVAAAVAWFFWGASWATRISPEPGAQPIAASALQSRLLALGNLDAPYAVTLDPSDEATIVSWKFEDSIWLSRLNARGLARTHRLKLRFDEANRRVLVSEHWSALRGEISGAGANLDWSLSLGIQFFGYDYRREFGIRVGPDGLPTGDASYAYEFNLQELKGPMVQTTLAAGWSWQPTLVDLSALRAQSGKLASR